MATVTIVTTLKCDGCGETQTSKGEALAVGRIREEFERAHDGCARQGRLMDSVP